MYHRVICILRMAMSLNIPSDLHLGQGALAAPRTRADAVVLADPHVG
jgi:hypothetical protein